MSSKKQEDITIDKGLKHKQVRIIEAGKEIFRVDEKLQSLIQMLKQS